MRSNAKTVILLLTISVGQLFAAEDTPSAVAAFSCSGRSAGYYADLETGCQKYHMCDASGRRYTYSCPNQTLFQQRVMICDHWFMVDCSLSETHFGANLLIGQKDRHFVEHFQQENSHSQDRARSYPTRTKEYYADPSTAFADDQVNRSRVGTKPLSESSNEIKQALLAKSPSFQSVTKKLFEEKESLIKASETTRYSPQFSQSSTGSIKFTSERSLTREFTNNPFFRSLTSGSQSATPPIADKGERDLLTFLIPHQGKDHVKSSGQNVFYKVRDENTRDGVSTSEPSRISASSLSPGTYSKPPNREVTPSIRNTSSFPNHHERRTSTLVTTAVPLTYDYKFVTSQGRANHPRTETPKLQNNFSSVNTDVEDFTSEPSLTTHFEFLKTRERVRTQAPVTTTRAALDLGVTPAPTQRAPPNETVGSDGVQRTPGGFRFKAVDATRVADVPATPAKDWGFTSLGVPPPRGSRVVNGPDETKVSKGNKASDSAGNLTPLVGFTSDIKYASDPSPISGPDLKISPVDDELDLSIDKPTASSEDDIDSNTVEVRVVDPRRMFFIPDSAAREAEMLSSNNETVLTIALPSSRHDGPMKFKVVGKSGGRRIDCPQCHPAFLLPGKCHPCVHIRR